MMPSAHFGFGAWGGGCGFYPFHQMAERGGGASEAEAEFAARPAAAVHELEGDFAEGAMPQASNLTLPGPVAQAFYLDDGDVVGIQGPVGSGKTTTLLYSRLRRAMQMPRSTIDGVRRYKLLIIRETYRQLWSTTIPSYLETFPRAMGEWSGGRGDPVTHKIRFEDDYGPIEFVAEFMAFGDDVIASMRGAQTTDIWINEADTVPVDVLTVGIGRIDRWPGRSHFAGYAVHLRSYGQIVCDFNAPDEENWTFEVFHDEKRRIAMGRELTLALQAELERLGESQDVNVSINFHNQPGGRDPGAENLQNLSASYYPRQIAALKLAGRGDMLARLVDNRITYLRVGDPVFQREFNRRIHVSDVEIDANPDLPLLLGLDQGFLGAAVVAQFEHPMHWTILAELMFPKERLLARVFGERLRDLLDDRFLGLTVGGAWGDMAGEHGASQAADENQTWNLMVGKAAGFRVLPQRIGTNRIQPRLEAVRAPLEYIDGGRPGMLIDPRCRHLIAAFEARYVWTDQINQRGDKNKVPDKSFVEANVMDALEYLTLSQVRGDGSSPGSFRRPPVSSFRGKPMPKPAGLSAGHSVLNPYGGRLQ